MKRIYLAILVAVVMGMLSVRAEAVQILYTVEGDSDPTLTDSLTGDGTQNGTIEFSGSSTVDTNPANAAFGTQSMSYPDALWSPTRLNSSTSLGTTFTLAAMARLDVGGFQRVFSTYAGSGPAAGNDVVFHFDTTSGTFGSPSLSLFVNGVQTPRTLSGAQATAMTDGFYHHLAATYNNGTVQLFLDGVQIGADGTAGSGAVTARVDLRFGEDEVSFGGEQFRGNADDILVYDEALTAADLLSISQIGAQEFFFPTQEEPGAVPEPATAALLMLACAGLIRRRRASCR